MKLTLYSSETIHTDHTTPAMQAIVDHVASGAYKPNIHKVFGFDELPQAQDMMEKNLAAGKLVVRV